MKLRKPERQQQILEEIRVSPSIRLGDLAASYGVTKETIRRDIDELCDQGHLARTYGGAVAAFMNNEPGLRERTRVNPEGRRRMAELAVELIANCGIVMIDTGATMAHICERLVGVIPMSGGIKLTAITNSLNNALTLGANSSIRVIICPGEYNDRENAAFGPQTLEFLGRYHVDAMLMSAGGISGENVTDANSEAVAVKRAMLRRADRSILVIEQRKFNLPQFETVCELAEIDDLVTDGPIPASIAATLTTSTRVHITPLATQESDGRTSNSGD